jgi:signal transduction histidine kinase
MGVPSELKTNQHLAAQPDDRPGWKSRLPLFGVFAALLAFTIIAAGSLASINSLQERARWVDHTHKVLSTMEETFSLLKDVRASARSFVLSGDPKLLTSFQLYTTDLHKKLTSLRGLTNDNARQIREIAVLETQIIDYLAHLEEGVALGRKPVDFSAALAYITSGRGERLVEGIRSQITMMQNAENKLLAERSLAVEESTQDTKTLIVFGTLGTYLMIGSTFWLLRRETLQRQRSDRALLEANAKLMQHANQLEITNKELESFSYSISHDLRIPLRAVSGYARMMEEDYGDKIDSEGQRLLKVIRDNSKRMGDLIDDLLAFSRLGRKEISANRVDMTELAMSAIEQAQRRDEYAHTRVVVDPLPPAWGDRALLQQVWINLVSNALKYSSTSEQPLIEIGAEIGTASVGSEVIYHVKDNGVGFDMKYYDKLFGVFQRLHSAEEFPGTGVGLAIVQRIVTRHEGRVWAEGAVGRGAVFSFALPLKEKGDA